MSAFNAVANLLTKLGEEESKDQESKPQSKSKDDEIENEEEADFVVTDREVSGKVDYLKLCDQFGCSLLKDEMITKMESLTGKRVHPMIRRKLYYAHRDFDKILKCHEEGKPWYLYTGRGI